MRDHQSGKKVLEFVSIQRKDTGEWAIPGGMVDPGEKVSVTVKREFMEEALDSTGTGKDKLDSLSGMVDEFFAGGEEVYKGYVDDPRNTDNAWMETVAFSFHDDTGKKPQSPNPPNFQPTKTPNPETPKTQRCFFRGTKKNT